MLPVLLVGGACLGSLIVVEAATAAVGAVESLGLWGKAQRLERELKMGTNSLFEEHKAQKRLKAKMPPIPSRLDDELVFFKFDASDLPPEMKHMAETRWCLTHREELMLLAMMRTEMLNRGVGRFGEQMKALCAKHGVNYKSVAKIAWEGLPSNYEYYSWISANRLEDPAISSQKPEGF